MAAKQMKKVAGHLTCPVCYELYKKPKYLPCHHTYCEDCIVKLQNGSNITCPECRITSELPPEGIQKLPNNFFVNRIVEEVALKEKVEGDEEVMCDLCDKNDRASVLCLDCVAFLCNYCSDYHTHHRDFQSHSVMHLEELKSKKKEVKIRKACKLLCQEHELEMNFYCDTCEQLVCHYCTTTNHNGHEHNTVKKMAQKYRTVLDKTMEPIGKMIENLAKAQQSITTTCQNLHTETDIVDKQIDSYYEKLQERIQQQKEELKKQLHEVCKQKKKTISVQLEEMEYTHAELESVNELSNAVKSGSDQEALFMKKRLTENIKRLTDCYNELNTDPIEVATVKFFPSIEYEHSCPLFGHILYGHSDPDKTEVIIPKWTLPGKVMVKIITKDQDGCRSRGDDHVAVEAQTKAGGGIPVVVEDNKDGSYLVTFVPNQSGEVKLSVSIGGKHIQGSPFTYPALNTPIKLINDDGRLGQPWGITFGKDGMWAVADHSKHCVYLFDGQDQVVRKFGSKGNGNGQFDSPAGIAFDADNNLYVACRYNHRVQKITNNGDFLLQFGSMGTDNGQLDCPLGLTIHSNKVYIADQCNHRISVFQCDGKFCQCIGQSGELNCPFDVAVNSNNHLFVANLYGNCISVFSLDGNYISRVGVQGSARGQLQGPCSLTIDMYGIILVTERENNRVSVFGKDGVFLHCFGSKGSTNGKFSSPCGIAVSPSGNIYITDRDNSRIQVISDYY